MNVPDPRARKVNTMETKERIFEIVKKSPCGIRVGDVAKDLGLNYNTATYWANRLVADGKIKIVYEPGKARLYPQEAQ